MSETADRIIDLYERHADAWVSARLRESGLYEREWLDRFRALVPSGGSVLDIGCGAGVPIARYFSERGYSVTGIDSSQAMVSLFGALLPDQRALRSDMRKLSLDQSFNGLLAWDSFFHLNPDDQKRMFPLFRAHAAPRAALMFTSGPRNGVAIGQLEGEPLYHASLDPAEYRNLLDDEGFSIVYSRAEDETCGGRTIWLAQLRSSGGAS